MYYYMHGIHMYKDSYMFVCVYTYEHMCVGMWVHMCVYGTHIKQEEIYNMCFTCVCSALKVDFMFVKF